MSEENKYLDFDFPVAGDKIIKVIGVGGGGGNAVTHMFKEGIKDVSFMLCNTDNQALNSSHVANKLQLGRNTTGGLGAGNKPELAGKAAEESAEDIKAALSDGTRMAFITAGMGGGTGTGAAPVIAKIAKDMGILTVGIVTIPFRWEGVPKINQALDGVERMNANVDALLVINNDLLGQIYPELTVMNGFKKADDTLTIAAKSIAEIITVTGYINLDFNDVNTIMRGGGVAIMSVGYGSGEQRLSIALKEALNSPLLNNKDVFLAKKVMFNISCSKKEELKMAEMDHINEFMSKFKSEVEVIWGISYDDSLNEKLKVTLLATGFDLQNISGTDERRKEKEEKEKLEADKKEREERLRRSKYYPDSDKSKRYKDYEPVVLTMQQLDDDEIIKKMESVPAYKHGAHFIM